MNRTLVGAGIGCVLGVLGLAVFGAWAGYVHGGDWFPGARGQPPAQAAVTGAVVTAGFFWWLGGGVGMAFGALAGFGTLLVRPSSPRLSRSPARRPGPPG